MKIDKIIVSVDDSHYQYFWPAIATVCKKVLNITPVLFKLDEEESDFYNDSYGLVKKIKKVQKFQTSIQGQLLRLYGTKYFQDEVCLISDIDMMLLNKKYFVDDLKSFSDDSYIIFTSDGYDLNRRECRDLFDFEVYPMCYHAAKGKIFTEILENDGDFEKFLNKVITYKIPNKKEWYSDEIYLSSMINLKYNNYEIHKLKRGYQDDFYIPNRIEKYNFPVDYRNNNEMKSNNLKLGNYDKEKLKNGYYIDCHCVRPYGWYEKEIWDVVEMAVGTNKYDKDLIMITSFCNTPEKLEVLRTLVGQISKHKSRFDLMVISHTTIPQDIAEKTDFTIYDKKNELLYDWDLRSKPWFSPEGGRPILSIYTGFFNTHLAIWRMIIIGNSIAKNCGYKKIHHIEYDSNIIDFEEIYENSRLLDTYDAITYNKSEKDVDDILFGTYQCYRIDTLHPDLYILDEDKIKESIKLSDVKSPEGMLFDLLHKGKNSLVKSKNLLDKNGNIFGISHHDLNMEHVAWCLPYYDRATDKLSFIVWNMEGKQTINVVIIYNDEKTFKFENIEPGYWSLMDIDDFINAKKLTVILNNKIRNIFNFTEDSETFKQVSYR
jgi:hypothetical protein